MSMVSNKLVKVNDSFSINMYDNGYMIEIGGRNKNDDWATSKIIVKSIEELIEVVKEISGMERE